MQLGVLLTMYFLASLNCKHFKFSFTSASTDTSLDQGWTPQHKLLLSLVKASKVVYQIKSEYAMQNKLLWEQFWYIYYKFMNPVSKVQTNLSPGLNPIILIYLKILYIVVKGNAERAWMSFKFSRFQIATSTPAIKHTLSCNYTNLSCQSLWQPSILQENRVPDSLYH